MSSTMTKRQQAKNERVLQDLVRSIPGNDVCADCSARNPVWASWNLGIFLCMRCAGLHRKVGTHITKVKSLSMDSWSNEQVEDMKLMGNKRSNQLFNPRNVKPSLPVDAEEADVAMEKYIRQKYERREFMPGGGRRQPAPQHTDRTSRSESPIEEQGPPLPPKPSKKFGFSLRSVSMPFHREKADKYTPPLSPAYSGSDERHAAAARVNKQSRVLGSNIGNQEENFDVKLASLREMGFKDSRRNSEMLKNNNGDLDRTVGELVRLGENSKPSSRALTPVSAGSPNPNGISVEKRRPAETSKGNNLSPWDALDQEQPAPQRAATMPLMQSQSMAQPQSVNMVTYNPFIQQAQHMQQQPQQQGLQNAFSNLQVSQQNPQSQDLNNTSNPFYYAGSQQIPPTQSFQQQQISPKPQYDAFSAPLEPPSNPFVRRVQSQTFHQSNLYQQQPMPQALQASNNPWMQQQQQQQQQQQYFVQTPQPQTPGSYQTQTDFFGSQQQQQPMAQPHQANVNPFYAMQPQPQSAASPNPWAQPNGQAQTQQSQSQLQQAQQPQYQQAPVHQQQQQYQQEMPQQPQYQGQQQNPQVQYQQQQQQMPQPQYQQQGYAQNSKYDKSSILALYNAPHLAPSRPLQAPSSPGPADGQYQTTPELSQGPASGSMNPFGAVQGQQAQAGAQDPNVGHFVPQIQQDAFSGLSNRWRFDA